MCIPWTLTFIRPIKICKNDHLVDRLYYIHQLGNVNQKFVGSLQKKLEKFYQSEHRGPSGNTVCPVSILVLGSCDFLDYVTIVYSPLGIFDMYDLSCFPPILLTRPVRCDHGIGVWCYFCLGSRSCIRKTSDTLVVYHWTVEDPISS